LDLVQRPKKEAKASYARGVIENALKKAFTPEFLNRIDDVVIFDSLAREDIHKIIDIELEHLFKRINELGYLIQINDKAKDFIVDKGWDEQYGARPLKRAIQRYIEDPLAEEIINHSLAEGDTIVVDYKDKDEVLKISIKKATKKIAKKK